MPIDSLAPLTPLAPLPRLAPQAPAQETPAAGGFGAVLNGLLDNSRQTSAAADQAVKELATGEAQDLHTVSLAVAQADLSFRMILEVRNRLSDALQEILRMQV
jgi:flagellar hook-basal body complex protein FliE